jgi:hypothetical protein
VIFEPVVQSLLATISSFLIRKRDSLITWVVINALYLATTHPIKFSLCYQKAGSGFGGRPFTRLSRKPQGVQPGL